MRSEVRQPVHGPSLPERRDRAHDEARVAGAQRLVPQPERVELAERQRVDEHVRAGDEAAEQGAAVLGRHVQGDAALAGVVVPEVEAALGVRHILVERADLALGGAAGRLDLDHVGALVGHELRGPLADLAPNLDHAQVAEGAAGVATLDRQRCEWLLDVRWRHLLRRLQQVALDRLARGPERAVLVTAGDLIPRHAEHAAEDRDVVRAEQRPPRLHRHRRRRQLERRLLHRVLADDRMQHRLEHPAVAQLRVVLDAVLVALHRRGAHACRLAAVGQLVLLDGRRPRGDALVDLGLVREATPQRVEPRVGRPLGRAHDRDEAAPLLVGEAGDDGPVVVSITQGAVGVVRRCVAAAVVVEQLAARPVRAVARRVAGTPGPPPVGAEVEERRAGQRHAGRDLREVDVLALAGGAPVVQRGQRGDRAVHAAGVVHVRPAPPGGRRVGQPRQERQPRQRLRRGSERRVVRVRPRLPEAGHRDVDEVGLDRAHLVEGEAPVAQHACAEVLDHDVRRAQQVLDDLQALRAAHVDRDAQLLGVLVVEVAVRVRARARVAEAARAAREGEPRVRPFDLDHLGAHHGQPARGPRPGAHPREVQYAYALEWPLGHGDPPGQPIGAGPPPWSPARPVTAATSAAAASQSSSCGLLAASGPGPRAARRRASPRRTPRRSASPPAPRTTTVERSREQARISE